MGVAGAEELAAHVGVLGRVDASAGGAHDGVEVGEELRGGVAVLREIQGQRGASLGERQQAWRGHVAKALEHRQEGPAMGYGDGIQHVADGGAAGGLGNHALVLLEALGAVDTVPVKDAVEWVEVRLVAHPSRMPARLGGVVVEMVEDPQRHRVDRRDRWYQRHAELGLVVVGEPALRRMVAHHVDAPPRRRTAGSAVDPGDGVFVLAVELPRQSKKLVQRIEADIYHIHKAALDGYELQLDPVDDASESESTDGGREEAVGVARRDVQPAAIRAYQPEAPHVAAEATAHVVVLTVYVIGNSAAKSGKLGTRCNR